MHPTPRLVPLLGAAALLLALGCASTPEADLSATQHEPMSAASPAAAKEHGADLALGAPGAALTPIYFDTDQSILRADAREALKRHAQAIQQHPEWGVVTVEGHCDERGNDEYNIALGSRRAAAVAQYLADLGVPRSRLEMRTFGEMRPAVAGHEERAWSKNRRSELKSRSLDAAQR